MVRSFLSLENLLSDSYTFIRTLTRLTIYMYFSKLLVYDIVNLVTVSTKCIGYNFTICMESIGFACVTAPVHLSSYCNQYTSSRTVTKS